MRFDLRQVFDRSNTPRQALARWGADARSLEALPESSNFVYCFFDHAGVRRYLRLIPRKHRSLDYVHAELEFVGYLKSQGCAVAAGVTSMGGNLIEVIEVGTDTYYATVFEEAPGAADKWGGDEQNRRILRDQGRAMGRIHACSARFQPTHKRFHWKDDGFARYIGPHLPESQAPARSEIEAVLKWVEQHPKTAQNYGLIHGDFGIINYRRTGDVLTVFDFDDCCYQWYAFDAAIALRPASRLPMALRRAYVECFMQAYAGEKEPAGMSSEELGWFSRLVSVCRYLDLLRNWDLTNLTEQQQQELKVRYQAVIEPVSWE